MIRFERFWESRIIEANCFMRNELGMCGGNMTLPTGVYVLFNSRVNLISAYLQIFLSKISINYTRRE